MGKKSKRARREREIQTKISNLEGIVVGKLKPHQYEGLQAAIDAYHGDKSRFILEPKPCHFGKIDFVSTPGSPDDHVKRAFEQIKAASTGQWKALRDDAAYIEQLKRELDYSKGQRDRLSMALAEMTETRNRLLVIRKSAADRSEVKIQELVSKLGNLEYKLIMQTRRAEKLEAKLLNPLVAASPVPSDIPERIAKDLYGRLSKHFYRDRGSRLSRIDELLTANCAMTEENRALKTRISELEVDVKARDMLAMSKTTSCGDEDREDEREDDLNLADRNLVPITDEELDTLIALQDGTAAIVLVNPNLGQPYSPSEAENLRRSHVIEPETEGNPGQRGADGREQRNTITVPPSTTDKPRTWIEMLDPATRKLRQPKILLPEEGRIFELISGDKGEAPRSLGFFVRAAALRDRFMGARLDIYHDGAPVSFMYITGINCPDTIVARTAAWSYAPEKE